MPADVVALIRDLYDRCRAGEMTDAEANWVLRVVLPVYGKDLNALARWVQGQG